MKIYKYPIYLVDKQYIDVPAGAQFLTVQMQAGLICLWALCDERIPPTTKRCIVIYGTGNHIHGDPGKYIGTVQDGSFVWHVFEELNEDQW